VKFGRKPKLILYQRQEAIARREAVRRRAPLRARMESIRRLHLDFEPEAASRRQSLWISTLSFRRAPAFEPNAIALSRSLPGRLGRRRLLRRFTFCSPDRPNSRRCWMRLRCCCFCFERPGVARLWKQWIRRGYSLSAIAIIGSGSFPIRGLPDTIDGSDDLGVYEGA
jgi:hypothetical protein